MWKLTGNENLLEKSLSLSPIRLQELKILKTGKGRKIQLKSIGDQLNHKYFVA